MNCEQISIVIRILSFVAMFFVVVIHSMTISAIATPTTSNAFIQRFVGSCMTCWAVPFFFAVSGYYFGKFSTRNNQYLCFYRKKIKTLLVPYILWIIIVTTLTLPLFVGNNFIMGRNLIERTVFDSPDVLTFLSGLFGILDAPRGNFPLWYVRALLIFFALAPLFALVKRLTNKYVMFAFALILCIVFPNTPLRFFAIKVSSVGYFLLGLSFYGNEQMIDCRSRCICLVAVMFYLLVAVVHTLAGLGGICLPSVLENKLYDIMPFLGIVSWWCVGCTYLNGLKIKSFMLRTFWVYCLHNAIVGYIVSGGYYIFGKTNFVSLLLFFITPVLTILVCLFASYIASKKTPCLYGLLTGGRG